MVAQSAWESGYGTSNLAVNNNNLFGFVGKKYDSIKDSIEAYAWQLNNGKQRGYKKARKYLKKIRKMQWDILENLQGHIVFHHHRNRTQIL